MMIGGKIEAELWRNWW